MQWHQHFAGQQVEDTARHGVTFRLCGYQPADSKAEPESHALIAESDQAFINEHSHAQRHPCS
jgi:uncharacterized protein (UPF0276 family)